MHLLSTFSRRYLKYIVSISLLTFLLLQMNLPSIWGDALNSNKSLLLLSTCFIIGQIFFLNLRWHAYLNAKKISVPFTTSVLINLAGYFANTLFITSVGGIIAKSGLAIKYGLSITHALFATFLDRFMTLAALIILSAISLPLLQGVIDEKILTMLSLSITFIIASILLIIGFLRLGIFKDFIMSDRKRSRGLATTREFLENYPLMIKTSVHSLAAQIFFVMAVFALSLNFEPTAIHPIQLIALVPILALISSLPISFGGWGVREGAFIYGLSLLGFSMEDAFLLSIQVGLVTFIAPVIVGLPYIIKDKSHLLNRLHTHNNNA